jgi:hypothetical protein
LRRLPCLTGWSRDRRPGMHGWIPFVRSDFLNRSASLPRLPSRYCALGLSSSSAAAPV